MYTFILAASMLLTGNPAFAHSPQTHQRAQVQINFHWVKIAGHWSHGRWVKAHWVRRPGAHPMAHQPRAYWIPGRYEGRGPHRHWVPGHWKLK